MGTCSCSVLERPTQFNYGGKLRFTWTDAHKKSYFDTPSRWCNPMNCSNSACKTKSCIIARRKFCGEHGYPCPYFKDRRCKGDPCPGGLKTCISQPSDPILYPYLPRCGDTAGHDPLGRPIPPTTNTPPKGGSTYKPPAGCQCGCDIENPVLRSLSCVGYSAGNFFTDAAKSGNEQFPMMLMVGAALVLILILKR